ncbi:MAG: HDIG domain-containing protein [Bacteroidetes bacterium]|nr:HDIG domain-containing protein [Bacteroidota bacterium]
MFEIAEQLLEKYIENENLRNHCRHVRACMMYYADKLGEDKMTWGEAGLLHDLDWEKFPDTHPNTAVPILEEAGYGKDFIDAILGHAYPDRTNVPRETLMAKYLFACDEITGLVHAYSLMKEGGIKNVEPKGVIKKMKDKAFARNVNRDDIKKGAEEIGIELSEHIRNIINAMSAA